MSGAIVGGWGWVAAAWGFSLAVLVGYAAWLTIRVRGERATLSGAAGAAVAGASASAFDIDATTKR